mgnify:CR=1 FL=1
MKKLFTEYWQEFDVQYIKNMYGAEPPLLYLSFTGAGVWFLEMRQGRMQHLLRKKYTWRQWLFFDGSLALFPIPCIR